MRLPSLMPSQQRLADIALSVDLHFYLRQWQGAYSLEWQGGDAAVVRFEREQDLKGGCGTVLVG